MRRLALTATLLVTAAAGLAASAGADGTHTYKVEMYNAFGIVPGSDVRIAGVNAGSVTDLDVNAAKRAEVEIELSGDFGVLGEDTTCSSEPQSLIAEYFIDCVPKGPPLPDGAMIPASRVSQTVQADLVQNTLREPFKRRLALIINEFGTALAGNAESLNEAIRLGAPSLTQLRQVTRILASQNRIIRNLNVDSDVIMARLNERREDVVSFVEEARDTAAASVARRAELSRNFEILDDFLAELEPTLADLEGLAAEQTPLLADLNAAAPGLNTLAGNLPPFNDATRVSLESLGEAGVVGKRALSRGRDEVRILADVGKKAPLTGEILADFVRDLDDPRRAVEIDDRVPADTGRTNPEPGHKNTKGYTGLEGLLNYVYYQPGALNQYDAVGHLLHFSLYNFDTGPCGHFSTGHDAATGEPGVPAEAGGTTTNILEADNCIAWSGPNQPGISEEFDLPKYSSTVCPDGTEPQVAEDEICDPTDPARATARSVSGGGGGRQTTGGGGGAAAPPVPQGPVPNNVLENILDLPNEALENLPDTVGELPGQLRDRLGAGKRGGGGRGRDGAGTAAAAEDLLDFLFSD